jgi:hypothetical protein
MIGEICSTLEADKKFIKTFYHKNLRKEVIWENLSKEGEIIFKLILEK